MLDLEFYFENGVGFWFVVCVCGCGWVDGPWNGVSDNNPIWNGREGGNRDIR